MKQNIFETRQRAQELMEKALNIWRASDQSYNLEGLEKDPVFSVIMSALAYQANEFDAEIEELKTEILSEFEHSLSVDAVGNAIPATTVLQTNTNSTVPVEVDSNMSFYTSTGMQLTPMLRSKVFNIIEVAVNRLDGRRWMVSLDFNEPVGSLDGMSFAIPNLPYHDIHVTVVHANNEMELNIITPSDTADLPLTEPFSIDTLLYNRTHAVSCNGEYGNVSPYYRMASMDVFARQETSLYLIRETPETHIPKVSTHWDLCFEFDGLGKDFVFNRSQIAFNVVLLANVNIRSATISKSMPLVRLTSSSDEEDFMYMLRPDEDQIFSSLPVMVRKVAVERFNRTRLVMLLSNLLARYNSDYYAFLNMENKEGDRQIQQISESLTTLSDMARKNFSGTPGVYVMIPVDKRDGINDSASLSVRYVTTSGDSSSAILTKESLIHVPEQLDQSRSRQIVTPQQGRRAIHDEQADMSIRRYMMTTHDRLVTPADLKLFCYNELMVRYSIVRDMVKGITVGHERIDQGSYHSYCIMVTIQMASNNFVKRAFEGKKEAVERYLQQMMKVRSANIYPIKVKLNI